MLNETSQGSIRSTLSIYLGPVDLVCAVTEWNWPVSFTHQAELQKLRQQALETKHFIEKQEAEERKLLRIIAEADGERLRQKKELDQVGRDHTSPDLQILSADTIVWFSSSQNLILFWALPLSLSEQPQRPTSCWLIMKYPFIYSAPIYKHFLCVTHSFKLWGYTDQQENKLPCLQGVYILA